MLNINIDIACKDKFIPSSSTIENWVTTTLKHLEKKQAAEIGIRIVDETESAELNETYRHKKGPTNILSFAYEIDPLSGDMAICASIVNREATELKIEKSEHWTHIVIHGVLHLLGFDHQIEKEATVMEALEINILATLGIDNPYA